MGIKQPEIIRSQVPVELGPPSDGGGRGKRVKVFRWQDGKVVEVKRPAS